MTDSAPFHVGPWTFDRVYLHDWEWLPIPGEQALHPLSVVVHELVSGRPGGTTATRWTPSEARAHSTLGIGLFGSPPTARATSSVF
jgi:hypothetical protein